MGRQVRTSDAAGGETTREYNERGLILRETQKMQAGVVAETACIRAPTSSPSRARTEA